MIFWLSDSTKFVYLDLLNKYLEVCIWNIWLSLVVRLQTMLFIAILVDFCPCCNSMRILALEDNLLHMQFLRGWANIHMRNRILILRTDFSCKSWNQKFVLIFLDLLLETISKFKKAQIQHLWLQIYRYLEWCIFWHNSQQKQGKFYWVYWAHLKKYWNKLSYRNCQQ